MSIVSFSYGGGVQSTAALVLAATKQIDFPLFVFANVGDDSEHPATLRYVREIAMPYASAHGIELVELTHIRRDGTPGTLYRKLTRPNSRSTGIPIYLEGSGAPARRSCTSEFKIRRIRTYLRKRGASAKAPATVGLGISWDEIHRMRTESGFADQVLAYPLIDRRLTRMDCRTIIVQAGLPVPPKSSCWFCPFHRPTAWQAMKRTEPALFDQAVALERLLSERSDSVLGRGKVFLTRKMIPLDQAIGDQLDMFDDDELGCASGYCMT